MVWHVWRRPIEASVWRVDYMEDSPVVRDRGRLREISVSKPSRKIWK